ncbi:HDIG domain-containing protein [Candidatus Kuenenbacteria bacterium]|nr:HDIG domain-containing protein [Candidatus Kuenenbacteria bacterium]
MEKSLSKLQITRETCFKLVGKYVSPEGRPHLFNTEAAMAALAREFGEDEHTWAMCGLLHDIDYEKITSKENMEAHMQEHCGEMTEKFLKEIDFPDDLIRAIQSHNEVQNIPRDSKLAKALFAVDGLTGFIVAVSKVMPDKLVSSVKIESVLKRFKEARFAAAVSRENIFTCESELGIPREKFVEIVLKAMKNV